MATALLCVLLTLPQAPELVSPTGRPFYARADTAGVVAKAESALAHAAGNVDTLIALGRAQASVWRYRDAVATYTRAIGLAPERAVLYRHRGHRYISLRELPKAVADLVRGDTAAARSLWREIVEGTYWPAFGFIAAEANLRRMP